MDNLEDVTAFALIYHLVECFRLLLNRCQHLYNTLDTRIVDVVMVGATVLRSVACCESRAWCRSFRRCFGTGLGTGRAATRLCDGLGKSGDEQVGWESEDVVGMRDSRTSESNVLRGSAWLAEASRAQVVGDVEPRLA